MLDDEDVDGGRRRTSCGACGLGDHGRCDYTAKECGCSHHAIRRGRNSKARGKAVEREVAKLLGLSRNRDGGPRGTPDLESDTMIVEVKSHQTPTPRWIANAWEQVMNAPDNSGRERATIHTFIDGGKRSIWLIKRLK